MAGTTTSTGTGGSWSGSRASISSPGSSSRSICRVVGKVSPRNTISTARVVHAAQAPCPIPGSSRSRRGSNSDTLIQQFGASLDAVDLDAAKERGIPVANVPAASTGNAASVAELAVLHLLALSRRLDHARDAPAGRPARRTAAWPA